MIVLFFGDSITQGFCDSEGGWVERLRKTNNSTTFFNLGIAGDSSEDVLARFDNETMARADADEQIAFVFAIGLNDSRTKSGINFSETEQYIQNLTGLLKQSKQYSDKILFVGFTPCAEDRSNPVAWSNTGYINTRIKEFDNALREFCEQNKVGFVEIFEPFHEAQNKTELLPDGIHSNNEGHQIIADLVAPKLQELLVS
jgi:lysophospholipase L1-like esterase